MQYDENSKIITAINGTTTLSFGIEDYYMTVSIDSYEQEVDYYYLPLVDISYNKIYVPIRYVAQAPGYVVTWDEADRATTLQSVDSLIASSVATYTVMDKYLSFNN